MIVDMVYDLVCVSLVLQVNHGKKREQVGGGGRGNKVRTYNFIENRMTDHRLEKKTSQLEKVLKGQLELLWKHE